MKTCTFYRRDSIINLITVRERTGVQMPAEAVEKTGGRVRMQDTFSFMESLLGPEGARRLGRARIAVFGIGGVGSYVAETLARCGVGSLTLVDQGKISESGIFGQLEAMHSTIGQSKVKVLKDRILDIDQEILVHTYESFFDTNSRWMFDLKTYDYIVDTMGDLYGKLLLIESAKAQKLPVLSCMGVRGRTDPQKVGITDISKTRVCPVAKAIRTELRKKGIRDVKVLYSREKPRDMKENSGQEGAYKKQGEPFAYMTGLAGMLIVHEVIQDLLEKEDGSLKKRAARPFGLAFHENRMYNTKLP